MRIVLFLPSTFTHYFNYWKVVTLGKFIYFVGITIINMSDEKESKLEKLTRREFMNAAGGFVLLAAAGYGIFKIPTGIKKVSRFIRELQTKPLVDILDHSYDVEYLASGLITPRELVKNPRGEKLYFVQSKGNQVFMLEGSTVTELSFAQKYSDEGVADTLISVNSNNQLCVFSNGQLGTSTRVYDLSTGTVVREYQFPKDGTTKYAQINAINHRESRLTDMKKFDEHANKFLDLGFTLDAQYISSGEKALDRQYMPNDKTYELRYQNTFNQKTIIPGRIAAKPGCSISSFDWDQKGIVYVTLIGGYFGPPEGKHRQRLDTDLGDEPEVWKYEGQILKISKI